MVANKNLRARTLTQMMKLRNRHMRVDHAIEVDVVPTSNSYKM